MHELEITPGQIARLVLGYLKAERCETAYEEFLKCSKHFKDYKGKIITRVDHKSLVDYLTEYSQVNILIQERIEETNFYNEQSSRTTLLEQLLYLLDYHGGKIRASTPNRSPIRRKLSVSDVAVNTEISEGRQYEVNATSLDSLPGNKSGREKHEKSSNSNKDESPSINYEALTQTLLEHHELHEKLADTINVVRNSPEQPNPSNISCNTDKNNTAIQDVEAAIKTIVQKATSDPFFDKLVKEVIGEEEESSDANLKQETGAKSNTSPTKSTAVLATNQNCEISIENPGKDPDNSLERYLKFHNKTNHTTTTTDNQNSVVVNSNNVLMLHSAPTVATIDISKPYYFINSTTQSICNTANVLSEQEIMSMPVVVCDDKQDKQGLSQLIVSNVTQPVTSTYLVNLAANPQISNNEITVPSVHILQSEQIKQKPSTSVRTTRRKIVPKSIPRTENVKVHIPELIDDMKVVVVDEKQQEQIKVPNIITPANNEQHENDVAKGVNTPRNGSHIRALDFSTPQKLFDENKVSPKSLKSKTKEAESDNENNKPKFSSWDSDLRGLVGNQNKNSPETYKKKTRKKPSKKLNKTAEEGKLIEKALLTISPSKKTRKTKKKTPKKSGDDPNKEQNKSTDDATNKLILSPSKLNANKRTLVDATEMPEGKTPEMVVVKSNNAVSSAKRNITPALQTPIKVDECPKTPGFFSPVNSSDTPFTKVLKEQLDGIDISTIPTPKFPVTPNFPFTPSIGDSRYPNRPTDYSSSSSYYHPSDNENNKSIEQLIEECNRFDGTQDDKKEIPVEKQIHILNEIRIPPVQDAHEAIAEKMKLLNKTLIGRKNLKLVEHVVSSSSSSSSSSSDSSSDESDSSRESNEKWCSGNETVISNQLPQQRYSLRIRKNAEKKALVENNIETITTILHSVDVKTTLQKPKTHDEILFEMEEKRKKTIEKLEKDQKQDKRPVKGKFAKKQVAAQKMAGTSKRRGRPPKEIKTKQIDDAYLSSDLEPFEMVEAQLLENSVSSTPTIASEKTKTIQQKRQRSPTEHEANKKLVSDETKLESAAPKESNKINNQDIIQEKTDDTSAISENTKANQQKRQQSPVKVSTLQKTETDKIKLECGKTNEINEQQQPSTVVTQETTEDVSAKPSIISETRKMNQQKRKRSPVKLTNRKAETKLKTIVSSKIIENTKLEALKKQQSSHTDRIEAELLENQNTSANEHKRYSTLDEKRTSSKAKEKITNELNQQENPLALNASKNIKTEEKRSPPKKAKLSECKGQRSVGNEKVKKSTSNDTKEQAANDKARKPISTDKKTQKIETECPGNPEISSEIKEPSFANNGEVAKEIESSILEKFVVLTPTEIDDALKPNEIVTTDSIEENARAVQSILLENLVSDEVNEKTEFSCALDEKTNADIEIDEVKRENDSLDIATSEIEVLKNSTKTSQKTRKQTSTVGKGKQKFETYDDTKMQPLDEIKEKQNTSEVKQPPGDDHIAERLVNDLKERGIHLVHNKSQKHDDDKEEDEISSDADEELKLEYLKEDVINGVTQKASEDNNQKERLETVDIDFEYCLIDKATVCLVHDPSKTPNKTLSDYDFSLLSKEMSAMVYLAEFDAEVQKTMICSPFDLLLDIPSKLDDTSDRINSSEVKIIPKIQKCTPLELLNKKLSDANRDSTSPLEGLYDEKKNSYITEKNRTVVNEETETRKQVKKHRDSKHKRARSLSNSQDKRSKKDSHSRDGASKKMLIKDRRSSEPKICGVNDDLNAVNGAAVGSSEYYTEVVDDDLMNYATVGTPEKSSKKRRADEKPDGEHIEKKIKPECQQLLKEIDVDRFLTQLHGDT